MNRSIHSFSGFVRSMQISDTILYAFSEGKIHDRYFYGKICESACKPIAINYTVCCAQELPGDNGGKQQLINFYKYLQKKKLFLFNFKGKKTAVIFFLDKDIDDFSKRRLHSDHVIYTKYHDIENHLFVDGNVIEAVAATSSLDPVFIAKQIGNYNDWRQRVASYWKDWVKICFFTKKRNIGCECTYSSQSRINNPLYDNIIDAAAYSTHLTRIEQLSGLSKVQFKRAFQRLSRQVDNIYNQNSYDLVFKGKWYSPFMENEIKKIVGKRPVNIRSFQSRLETALLISLDFYKHWAYHFTKPLSNLTNQLI